MTHQITATYNQLVACLDLADGSSWCIAAKDVRASQTVSRLMAIMQLTPFADPLLPFEMADVGPRFTERHNWLNILFDPDRPALSLRSSEDGDTTTCTIGPTCIEDLFTLQLVRLSQVLVTYAEMRGGILLHGALIEKEGRGVILAGPGSAGKTTATQRLALPWRPLCDDTTLVVCDENGTYWAHPWPTWTSFLYGGAGGSWDVQNGVPLNGIFFLEQAQEENFEPVSNAQTVCLLTESAEQTLGIILNLFMKYELRIMRLKRFENICNISQVVPSFVLRLGLNGPFWLEIERALDG